MRRLLSKVRARVFLWFAIFRSFKGLTLKSWVSLFLSPLFHIPYTMFGGLGNVVTLWGGMYFVRRLGAVVYVRGGTEDIYYLLPGREDDVERVVFSLLRPGDVFVDVGANVGYYTLAAAMKGCHVVAVEAVPSTVAVLLANIRLNNLKDVVIVPYCAWHEDGFVSLQIPLGRYYGIASAFYGGETEVVKIPVKCIRLDKILDKYPVIKPVKIDVEGAEYEVLRGLEKVLPRVKFIVLELSRNASAVVSYLRERGFKIRKLRFGSYILAYRC